MNRNRTRLHPLLTAALIGGGLIIGAIVLAQTPKADRRLDAIDPAPSSPNHRQQFNAHVAQLQQTEDYFEQADLVRSAGELAYDHPDLLEEAMVLARKATYHDNEAVRLAGRDVIAYLNRKYYWKD